LPGFEDAGWTPPQAVLEECAKFNEGVVAPLNWEGDKNPSSGKTAWSPPRPASRRPFKQYAEGGWQGLQHPVDFGGQGLPKTIGAPAARCSTAPT
jgi:alkylation response protein AidB-like acyl-CoA dehydrogenase